MNQTIIQIDLKGVNCYLGKEGDNFILFDTGGHTVFDKIFTNRRKTLQSELEKLGCKPGNLKLIVLTHGDIDHVANAVFIRDQYQTKIAMQIKDVPLVESLTLEKMMQSFRFRSMFLKAVFQLMKQKITRISKKILDDFQSFSPNILLNEGDSLGEYGFDAKILHIPGHTEGSIAVLTQNGDLIAGDIFMNAKKLGIAPNAIDFEKLGKSVTRLKKLNLNIIYPGHGQPFRMSEFIK